MGREESASHSFNPSKMNKRGWSCLVIDPDRVFIHASAHPEIDRLLQVPQGRAPMALRSKDPARVAHKGLGVYLLDYRDAKDAHEMALARALPHNYGAWAVLSPLGYHTIMRERYFRGRVLVTAPGPVLAELTQAWHAWHRPSTPATTPRPVEDPIDTGDSDEESPPQKDDRHAALLNLLAGQLGPLDKPVPSASFPY